MDKREVLRLANVLRAEPRPITRAETEQLADFLIDLLEDDEESDKDDDDRPDLPIMMLINGQEVLLDNEDSPNPRDTKSHLIIKPKGGASGRVVELTFAGWPLKVEVVE